MNLNDLTLDVEQSVEVKGDIGDVFKGVLHRFGKGNTRPDGVSMDMTLEEWAGGRWFRDRGAGVQHLWGHVQVIKPPTLIEICGPMFMSYPAASHMQYRLVADGDGTLIKLIHRAFGTIPQAHREGVNEGWQYKLNRVKEIAESRR